MDHLTRLFHHKVFKDIYRYLMFMARKIEIRKEKLTLTDDDIEGFLERTITPFGTSAKADVPKRYIGKKAYVIITKKKT